MSTYKLTLNTGAIDAAGEKAFVDTAYLLSREFTRIITEPRTWDGFDGPRDIVDTGQLRSAQQVIFTKPLEAVFAWSLEYASPVHDGYTLRDGRKVEGRAWTTIALQEFDAEQTFSRLYQRNLNSI